MAKGKETALVNSCLSYLHAKGIMAWRNNTGGLKIEKRFVRFGQPGSSDIFAIIEPSGRFVAIECKVDHNEITDLQRDWLIRVSNAGGLSLVVYSLDDLMAHI